MCWVSNLYDHEISDSDPGCVDDDFANSGTVFYENIQVREREEFLFIEEFEPQELLKFYILCKLQGTSVDILAKSLRVLEDTSSSGFPGKVLNHPSIPRQDQAL